MRFVEGRAWIAVCPRCERPIIEAHVNGLKHRLSSKALPLKDATVLAKYELIVINLWIGATQLWATAWFAPAGRPSRGRLYSRHICGVWR